MAKRSGGRRPAPKDRKKVSHASRVQAARRHQLEQAAETIPTNNATGHRKSRKPKAADTRAAFLLSPRWGEFRNAMLVAHDFRCDLCGVVHRGRSSIKLGIHHKDPENYEVLTPSAFSVLCRGCHEVIHQWHRRVTDERNPAHNPEIRALVAKFCWPQSQAQEVKKNVA